MLLSATRLLGGGGRGEMCDRPKFYSPLLSLSLHFKFLFFFLHFSLCSLLHSFFFLFESFFSSSAGGIALALLLVMPQAYPLALVAAAYLAITGYRKGSLSTSGAIAAFFIGYLTLANPVKAFGLTLLGFYLIGSRATKIGHEMKARLEREYLLEEDSKVANHKAKSGGQRNWVQVCCNGLGGALTSLAFRALYSGNWQGGFKWCLLKNSRPTPAAFLGFQFDHQTSSFLPRSLFFMMLGHFAVSFISSSRRTAISLLLLLL